MPDTIKSGQIQVFPAARQKISAFAGIAPISHAPKEVFQNETSLPEWQATDHFETF
ncbi:hypothetical protein QO002_001804 [Pararhizobium capsulatum DSM 1112]|uniref:Uncharacterized protein n=1 Tax=Pararhizobium capsulatum DSM 1112 TaxID=1121113 RepID=A0ABU0BN31_9HYPH|nr:hypothetical protein [Pararhizobium capsulatum]MDQ0319666.1 hypothetical protein [Pararhizobium capsulatum DSM 1112]